MSIFDALANWLADPLIKIQQAQPEEIIRLNEQIEALAKENQRLQALYAQECCINLRLVDLLAANGIKWR